MIEKGEIRANVIQAVPDIGDSPRRKKSRSKSRIAKKENISLLE